VKPEAEEMIPCAGSEGRVIGKGGATISRLSRETGARINMEKGSGRASLILPNIQVDMVPFNPKCRSVWCHASPPNIHLNMVSF